ncbi:MAG: peptidylprolyl isomerase [Planctomycetaceae bacterium]|nr:peptidylprolyl isomerase [Planctomycetaceae bacterium]
MAVISLILAWGCAAKPEPRAVDAPLSPAPREGRTLRDLVAIVDGQPVVFDELRGPLVEMSGTTALQDATVDLRLRKRLEAAGISLDGAAVAREREYLLDALAADQSRALELLGEIRTRQGLGDTRFAALLWRNAALRALVAREVKVDDAGLAATFDTLHGPKRRARIAVLGSLVDAERFRADLDAGASFAELAAERSLDDSAARGGLIGPLARRDPSYPDAVRNAVFAAEIGTASAPVLDGPRFFIVQATSETPADGVSFEAARARCEEILRRSRERLLMDALARELARRDGVTVFDRTFDAK